MASLRTRLQLTLVDVWQQRGLCAWLLTPLSAVHYLIYRVRRALYASGLAQQTRLDVPLVVIGNLYVGGTGKTPLAIELARALATRGWRPGIVSRGYGAADRSPRMVTPGADARSVGDEPLLIARAARVPVAVGRDRAAAARLLRLEHPECNVLIADDGLQHWPLARDMEIALVHYRGLGNGWLLPAGPLREPRARLSRVDAIVCNGEVPPLDTSVPRYRMQTALQHTHPLLDAGAPLSLAAFAERQRQDDWQVLAAAGIGMPDRFFEMLRAAGIRVSELPLEDHYDFAVDPFAGQLADRILVTEKDAVKCAANPALANDSRIWVVPLATTIDSRLVDHVVARLQQVTGETARGPSAA